MSIKNIESLISIKFFKRKNKIYQHFIFTKKKDLKYLRDKRYTLYDKLESKIKGCSLNLNFLQRREENDRVVLEYYTEEEVNLPDSYFFVIAGFAPPTPGCEYCIYRVNQNGSGFFCNYKQKYLTNKLKSCKFFKQSHNLFKT